MKSYPWTLKRATALKVQQSFSIVIILGLLLQPIGTPAMLGVFSFSSTVVAEDSDPDQEIVVNEKEESETKEENEEEIAEEEAEEKVESKTSSSTEESFEEGAITPQAASIIDDTVTAPDEISSEEFSKKIPDVNTSSEKTDQVCVEEDFESQKSERSDWEAADDGKSAETKEKIKVGVKYIYPGNEEVSVIFRCLPRDEEKLSKLRIAEMKARDIALPQGLQAASEYAYDITTEMKNGDFEYELTLPKSDTEGAEVRYIEKTEEEVTNGKIDAEDLKNIDAEDIQEKDEVYVVSDLDHFTVFIEVSSVVPENKITICHSTSSAENPYTSNEVSISAVDNNECAIGQGQNGHGTHEGDIIPPFSVGACSYPGQNWDEEGQEIYANNCSDTPAPVCGDGIVNRNTESCDYGSLNGNSSCSETCEWQVPVCSSDPTNVTNGEFESPAVSNSALWDIFADSAVGGWSAEWYGGNTTFETITRPEPQIELHNGVNNWTTGGNQYIELDSDWDGPGGNLNGEPASLSLYQDLPTIVGNEYTISWKYAARPGHNNNRLAVAIGETEVFDSGNVSSAGTIDWITESATFVATSTLTRIRFTEKGNPDSLGMFLDDVRVACTAPESKTAEVTMCKVNERGEFQSGWTLMLEGKQVQNNLGVPASNPFGEDSISLTANTSYIAKVSGTWTNNRSPLNLVDAEYSTEDNWGTQMDGFTGFSTDILELQINSTFDPNSNWGAYNSAHQYAQTFVPSGDGPVNFRVFDGEGGVQNPGWFGDNSGTLNVDIVEGYAGITGEDGCVTFSGVPYGNYTPKEILQDGWVNVGGLNAFAIVDTPEETFEVVNRKLPTTGTLRVEKVLVNDNGQTKKVEEFSFSLNQELPVAFETDGSNDLILNPGVYTVTEVTDKAYETSYEGCTNVELKAGETKICTITNNDKAPVRVVATKIICTDEADLPNWGTGGPNITATTALSWVSDPNHPSCRLAPDWQFEWSYDGVSHNGDNVPSGGTGWTPSAVTNGSGQVTIEIPNPENSSKLWFREVYKENFIPFTFNQEGGANNQNPVSAEIYCHNDVLNYDNWDWIGNPQNGETYYCVAWNVPKTPDVEIIKTDLPDPVLSGHILTYTLTAKNNGPNEALNVLVNDVLPANFVLQSVVTNKGACSDVSGPTIQCEVGTLIPDQTAVVTVKGIVLGSESLLNTATAGGSNGDTNEENNTDTEPTAVLPVETTCLNNTTWANEVTAYTKGTLKGGGVINDASRIVPGYALGTSDSAFYSIGRNGSLTVKFSQPVVDVVGVDLSFHEVTNGRAGYPLEQASVSVSTDGNTFFPIGTVTSEPGGDGIEYLDFSSTGLETVQYVRIADTTNFGPHTGNADGYDIEAIDARCGSGTIIIQKETTPNESTEEFQFFGSWSSEAFTLTDGQSRSFNLLPGEYSVSEESVEGWQNTFTACSTNWQESSRESAESEANQPISLQSGQVVKCVFTNTKLGSLTIVKNTIGGDGTFEFVSGGLTPASFSLTTVNGTASKVFSGLLPSDTYSYSENVPEGWELTDVSCSDQSPLNAISISAGEDVVCTVTNTKKPITIVASKIVCENEADLPNWGDGSLETIDANTASDWVASKEGKCRLESGWDFEWGPENSGNAGNDLVGPAGGSWTSFDSSTNALSEQPLGAMVVIPSTTLLGSRIEVREVLKTDYLPFGDGTTTPDFSAEMYCTGDTVNYDNWEWLNNPIAGNTYYCVAWNVLKPVSITGTKFNDVNGDGVKGEDEGTLAGWTLYLDLNKNGNFDEGEPSGVTGQDGTYTFANLVPGSYVVGEINQEGWKQTVNTCGLFPEVSDDQQENEVASRLSKRTQEEILPGETRGCFIGNQNQAELRISKEVDSLVPENPNNIVIYTLRIEALENKVLGVEVTDLPPKGFDVIEGTEEAESSLGGGHTGALALTKNYASPGKWSVGDLVPGEIITLTYQAQIAATQDEGVYEDLAFAEGTAQGGGEVIANNPDAFVGTKVAVVLPTTTPVANIDTDNKKEIDTDTEEKTEYVLGAATGLPATGTPMNLLALAGALFLLGLSLILFQRVRGSRSLLIAVVLTGAFFGQQAEAAPGALQVLIETPDAVVSNANFKIGFVALDRENREVNIECVEATQGVYQTINLIEGGSSEDCQVNSALLTTDGVYEFFVRATAGGDSLESAHKNVTFDGTFPGTPYNFERDEATCDDKITFTTANDGQTVSVELYRSTEKDFDAVTPVETLVIGSNQEGLIVTTPPDCNEDYWYALRALDSNGNASGFVADRAVNVDEINRTRTETTTVTVPGVAGGALPAGTDAGQEGSVEGAAISLGDTANAEAVLGDATTTENEKELTETLWNQTRENAGALALLGVLLGGGILYGFSRRKSTAA